MADQDLIGSRSSESAANMAKLVYALYLVGLIIPLTSIVGVIIAYIYRGEAPDWVKSHHQLQIRTFWIGLLLGVLGVVASLVLIGYLILLFLVIWMIIRCVIGLKTVAANQPYPKPETWLW